MTPGQLLALALASLTSAPLAVLTPHLAPDDGPAAQGVPDARQPVPGVDAPDVAGIVQDALDGLDGGSDIPQTGALDPGSLASCELADHLPPPSV